MKLRIATALAVAALAFWSPGQARASVAPIKAPVVVSSDMYACSATSNHLFSGRGPLTTSNENGVVASIQPSVNLDACDVGPFGGEKAASLWVALVPGQGSAWFGQETAILQVGVIEDRICTGFSCQENYAYFMANGGCNGALPTVQMFDNVIKNHNFGTPVGTKHKYRIDVYTGRFLLTMDDITIFDSITDGQWSRISCWAQGSTKDFVITGEKSDHGDAYSGTGAVDVSSFTGMKRHTTSWLDLAGTTCEYQNSSTPHSDGCAANGTSMNIWTN